jgi:replicative DNA helicase
MFLQIEDTEIEKFAFQDKERLDVEDLIISYLLEKPDRILETAEQLLPTYLQMTPNRIAYQAMIEMARQDLPIDGVQLEIYLDRQDKLNIIGSVTTIAIWVGGSLMVEAPTQKSIDRAIAYVIEVEKRKTLLADTHRLQKMILGLGYEFDDVVVAAEQLLLKFLSVKAEKAGLEPIKSTIGKSVERILKKATDKKAGLESEAILTGFADLDKKTGGLQRSDLVVVAARTSMGKSAYLQNMLLQISQSHPVAMFSVEMSTQQIHERYISMLTQVEASRLRDGDLLDSEYDKISQAGAKLANLEHWGCDGIKPTMSFVTSECRKLAAKKGKLGAIAIDHIGLLVENHENTRTEINRILKEAKLLAVELDCPVILVSQINRGCETRNDKRPQMSDLAESSQIENDANVIMMLYRDGYYNPDSKTPDLVEVFIRKNRGGECGATKLTCNSKTVTFRNYAEHLIPQKCGFV